MTAAEFHQQQLEQQEYEQDSVWCKDERGRETQVHIWGDDEDVYFNVRAWPSSLSLYFTKQQAQQVVRMLNNALRG